MKLHYWIIALGVYMLAMGIVGYVRTGSPTALFINGGIAVATMVLGYFAGGSPTLMKFCIGWVALNTVLLSYMTFKRIAAHSEVRAGSEYIFGTMAVFSLIVLILLIRDLMKGTSS